MMVFSRKRFLSIDGAFTKRWFTLKLNTKQQEVQQICRRIAEEDLKPNAAYFDKNALFPQTQLKNLADNGFLRAIANPKNQGLGLDMLSLAVGVEELSRGCASTGFLVAIHNALFVNLLETRGSEEQQRVFLRESPRDKLGSFALSEPDAGSDVASIKTTATRGTDAWILNGEKCWVTNAPEADAMITFATTDKELKHNGLTCWYYFEVVNAFGAAVMSKINWWEKLGAHLFVESVRYVSFDQNTFNLT